MMAGDRERIWNDMKWYGRDRGDDDDDTIESAGLYTVMHAWSIGSILFPKVIMKKKNLVQFWMWGYYDTI